MREIIAFKMAGDRMHLAFWVPYEFFVAAGWAKGVRSMDEAEEELAILKPYVVIVAQAQTERADGTKEYASEEEIRSRAVLRLLDGTGIKPLETIPTKISAVLGAMKGAMSAQGTQAKKMHVLVFPAKHQGKSVVNTARRDKLVLVLKANGGYAETVFTWRTPFDAVAPAAPCAKCGGEMSARWSYCPWCGAKAPALAPGAE